MAICQYMWQEKRRKFKQANGSSLKRFGKMYSLNSPYSYSRLTHVILDHKNHFMTIKFPYPLYFLIFY